MKPRERVESALRHERPDRHPMQISYTPEFVQRLSKDVNINTDLLADDPWILDKAVGSDLLLHSIGWMTGYNGKEDRYVDEWNVGWKATSYETPFGIGRYTDVEAHPLADDEAISSYKTPDPYRPELYEPVRKMIKKYKEEYWIVGVAKTTIFECAWALRGLEQLLVDFLVDPDTAESVLSIPYSYHLKVAKELVRMGVDMIWIGDDVGSQKSMMISPDMWRKYLKPLMADLISELRSINKNIVIAYHSDGVITPIIPELIDIGLDVLNPVQPNCMDIEELKNNYGRQLSFWGGIDQQSVLPFSSSEEVFSETKRVQSILGKDGGYIAGPTHNVQLDVPLENFWAMVNAITK